MQILRKNQQNDLLVKLTSFIKNKLEDIIDVKKEWTGTEIAIQIGSHSSRISEIRNDSRTVSRSIFRNLLKEKFFKIAEIEKELKLNEKELEYIQKL